MRALPAIAALGVLGAFLVTGRRDAWVTPPEGMRWEPLFRAATAAHGLPAGLLSRVAFQESRYDPNAYNERSDATGMMQIVPKWHPTVANYRDPAEAIPYAAGLLAGWHQRFGTWARALAAYNWGPTNLQKHLDRHGELVLESLPAETRAYVAGVTHDTGLGIA